jgi:predicted ester cyclase
VSNKATMQRFYDEVSAGNLGIVDELLSDDLVEHDEFPGIPQSKAGVKQFFEMSRAAFPDLRMVVTQMVEEGDVVMAHGLFEGTNDGSWMGMPPTGRRVSVPIADVVRFGEDGLAIEHWGVTDTGAMMQQLGLVPEPAA